MKNKALNKGISVILAVLICLSSLLGAGVPAAYAAPVQEEVIPIAYPREGDANFSADWGHDTLHFMNGWTIPAATQFTFRAMGLYSGTICYCIEPGVAQTPGDILTQFGEDFWENYPADYNSTIAPYDIKLLIGRIFQYGYTGNVSSFWYSQEESGEFIANAIATQLVIWETVVGERDSDFNHVDPSPYDAVLDIVRSGHPLREKILSYYDSIISNVQMHSKLPSFMSKATGKAQNIELAWNGSQYTAALTDTNGVLENYTFAANDPGVTVTVSGNVLTLSAPVAPSSPVSITADKKNPKRSGVVVWSDGVINPSGTIQDVAVYSAEVTDPIKGYLNAKASYGSVKIVKASEDGIVEGLAFTITGDGYSNSVALDSTGTALIENLNPGTYQITEQSIDRYAPQSVQTITVVSGQTVTASFHNTLKRGSLHVTKTAEDGHIANVRFKLSGTSLNGSNVELYAVTDAAGVAVFENVLISGDTPYVLEEINTADQYVVPVKQNVTISWNTVAHAQVENKLKYGSLKVTKTSEDGLVAGIKFKLSGTSLSGEVVELYATTDTNGIATFTDVLISGSTPFVLEEVDTADRYIVPDKQNITIAWNAVSEVVVDNTLKRGSLKVSKTSEDTLVEGVRFKLSGTSLSGHPVELYAITDARGVATFTDVLISGDTPFVLEEMETAKRYIVPDVQHITINWNAVTVASVHNELKRGHLKVTKTSEDGLVEGMKFKLSGTALSGQAIELYAETDANGIATFTDVPISGAAPFVLEEVDTAERYIAPEKQDVVIEWNAVTESAVHNELKRGNLKVTKTSEDSLVEGIKFKLSGTSLSGETVELYATTNSSGVAVFEDVLITGSSPYVLEEVETAECYIIPEAQEIVIEWNTVAEAPVYNELKRGEVKVTKNSEDGLISGVQFRLYGTSLSGASVNLYATTDENGIAVFEDVLIGSNYTLVEVNTSNRYVIPEAQSVTVNWNEVTECAVENILKKFKIEALKVDDILVYGDPDEDKPMLLTDKDEQPVNDNYELPWPYGYSQGDATLEGAVYGLYKDGVLLDTYTTDEHGRFTTNYYPCGDGYYLLELTPSEGYMVDPWEYWIYAWPGSYTVELNTEYYELYEEIIRGQIEIVKHTDDGETKFETPEVGAEFEVYLKSAGSYDATEEWERDYLVIDEDGFATSKKLPYGTYVVTQLSGWEGRDYIEPFEVTITESDELYRYIINNAEFESYIKVTKTDATTGKTIPYAGAAFQIYDPEGNLVTMQYTYPQVTVVDTFYTITDGTLITPEKLPYGKGYSLVEVQATDGYVLDSTPVYFDVTQPNSKEENNILVINVVKGNMPQMGTVTISKTGEIFSSVTEKDGIYQIVYETAGLEGAVFEIFAAEDVVTPDGTVRYHKDEKVDTITTGSDGKATSKELYLGKFYMKEIEAPYGMLLNGETVAFELTYAGQEVSVTSIAVTMTNERQKIVLDLLKAMEQDETFKLGMNGEISKVSFGLYAAEELVAADGTKIPKGGLLEIAQCDAEGKAVFTTDVPVGSKLYVKEYATDADYLPSDTTYPVEFVYAGQEVAAVIITVNNGEVIQNELIRGSVEGLKKDEDGNVVAGAEFGLFWADATEFTKENAILIATSDDAGVFRFENLPSLNFIIKELSAPAQYVLSDEAFEVEITEDEQVITIEAVNVFLTGSVSATKTDKDTAEKLSGAVFVVYVDSDGDKIFGEKDVLYGTLTETETGVYSLEALRYGGYFLHEKESPVNYNGNSEYHYFAITEDGKTITIETTGGKGFENEAYKGTVQIIKKDAATDEVLSGVEFGLYDLEGNELARGKTDDTGVLVFEQIRYGMYEIRELTPKEGYQKNETVTQVEITEDGQTVTVELTNEKIPEPVILDNPKAGDDMELVLWIGAMLISLSGVVVLVTHGYRKKTERMRKEHKV